MVLKGLWRGMTLEIKMGHIAPDDRVGQLDQLLRQWLDELEKTEGMPFEWYITDQDRARQGHMVIEFRPKD